MGRRTYEIVREAGESFRGKQVVASETSSDSAICSCVIPPKNPALHLAHLTRFQRFQSPQRVIQQQGGPVVGQSAPWR
jgi:hypothetical protein